MSRSEAFPDFRAEVEGLLADGDAVVAHLQLSGTNTGEYRGLPEPTGQAAQWEAVGIFRLVDGKIAEIRGVADRMGMLTQLGILPAIG
jgi:predicted ester cyclase